MDGELEEINNDIKAIEEEENTVNKNMANMNKKVEKLERKHKERQRDLEQLEAEGVKYMQDKATIPAEHQERFEAEKQQNILERAKLGPEIYDIGKEIERTKEACKEEDLKKDEIWDRLAIKVRDRRLKEEKIVEVEVQLKSLPPQ